MLMNARKVFFNYHSKLLTAEVLSGQNTRAWVSMVLYL